MSLLPLILALAPAAARHAPQDSAPAQEAVLRALPLMQESATTWTREQSCFSCHHQGMGGVTFALAEELGFPIDRGAAEAEADAVRGYSLARYEALLVCDGVGVFGRATTLLALGARGRPRDDVTDAVAHFLAARQARSGAWYSNEHRPPFEDSHVTATALTLRALQLYGPEGRAGELAGRIDAARRWLLDAAPLHNEDRSLRLLGLAWAEAPPEVLADAARDLLAQQRPDGGWAQLPTRKSDAYATGQALVALHQAGGVSSADPRWRRGAAYLVRTQQPDGSWFVATRRRVKGLPMVDSGFPHRRHQFVSYFASTWSTMALALATRPRGRTRALFGPPPPRVPDGTAAAHGLTPLMRAAAFGGAGEVRALLEAGAEPDERGPKGITAMMLAANDLEKIEALLGAGADPKAQSEWCNTPLLQASQVSGAGAVVQRLLDAGGAVDTVAVNGASSLFAAANLGDVELMAVLVEAGARLEGRLLEAALVHAADCDDQPAAAALLELGADIDLPASGLKFTPLIAASTAGHLAMVEFLLEAGADVHAVDEEGLTALHWASKSDPGHTGVVEALLAAGADADLEDPGGRLPEYWARRYRSPHLEALLSAAQSDDQ